MEIQGNCDNKFKEVKDFIINEKGTEIITLDSDGADSNDGADSKNEETYEILPCSTSLKYKGSRYWSFKKN